MDTHVQRALQALGLGLVALGSPLRAATAPSEDRELEAAVAVHALAFEARRLDQHGKHERALALWTELAERRGGAQDWRQLGRRALASGKAAAASSALRRALAAGASSPCAQFDLARALAASGDEAGALEALELAIRRGYDDAKAIQRSEQLAALREDARFTRLVETMRDLSERRARGCTLWKAEDWEGVAELYGKLAEDMPERGAVYHRLGFAQITLGRAEASERSFAKQLELGHEPHYATYNLACACARQGKTDAALRWLERSIDEGFHEHAKYRSDADLASLRDGRASGARFDAVRRRLLARLRAEARAAHALQIADWEGAVEEFTRIRELAPEAKGRACEGLARAHFALGDYERAARMREAQVAAGHKVPCALYELARCEARRGDDESALARLRDAHACGKKIDKCMGCDDAFSAMRDDARFLAMQRRATDRKVLDKFQCSDWSEVEAWAKKRLARNPRNGKAWHRLAWSELRRENWDAALAAFAKQEQYRFKTDSAVLNRACTHALAGDKNAALKALTQLTETKRSACLTASCLRQDPDLATLRDDPRFEAILERLEK